VPIKAAILDEEAILSLLGPHAEHVLALLPWISDSGQPCIGVLCSRSIPCGDLSWQSEGVEPVDLECLTVGGPDGGQEDRPSADSPNEDTLACSAGAISCPCPGSRLLVPIVAHATLGGEVLGSLYDRHFAPGKWSVRSEIRHHLYRYRFRCDPSGSFSPIDYLDCALLRAPGHIRAVSGRDTTTFGSSQREAFVHGVRSSSQRWCVSVGRMGN
jgi:hypothetical protein